jgi:dethiobiotin synthetase
MKKSGSNTLFVTGTDTSVGKTYVCARLLEFLTSRGRDAAYQKWVATGVSGGLPEDLAVCRAAVSRAISPSSIREHVPYCFKHPASPHLAAAMEGAEVEPEFILQQHRIMAARHEWLIVEGVGGILVPLRRDLLLADLLARVKPRTLVVARSGLGTLNHTLLTLEALRSRNIPVLGVVFSDQQEQEDDRLVEDNLRTIETTGRTRVFGRLHRLPDNGLAKSAFVPVGEAILAELLKDN